MKKLLPTLLPLTAGLCLLCSAPAHAVDGIINITGVVNSHTCKINGNDGYDTSTIQLLPVNVKELASEGATTGMQRLPIRLTECTGATARLYFNPNDSAKIDSNTGNLKNTATTDPAGNVQVQLLNSSGVKINPASITLNGQGTLTNGITSGNAYITVDVQYVAVGGAATAGNVEASVEYTILYE